jgi:hypothetical protein
MAASAATNVVAGASIPLTLLLLTCRRIHHFSLADALPKDNQGTSQALNQPGQWLGQFGILHLR